MSRYRSKPIEVDAEQWDGTVPEATRIIDWVLDEGGTARFHDRDDGIAPFIAVDTNNGTAFVRPGHWMVRGPHDFYPCDPATFADRWERAS